MKKTILLLAFLFVTIKLCTAQKEFYKFPSVNKNQVDKPTLYRGIGYSLTSGNGCIVGIKNVTGTSGILFTKRQFTAFCSTRVSKKASIYCNLVTTSHKRAEVTGEFGVNWIKEKDHFVCQIGSGYNGRYKIFGIYLFFYIKQ